MGRMVETELPQIGPYTITGSLQTETDLIRLAVLQLNVGDTDVTGEASYGYQQPRPRVIARFVSQRVNIDDLRGVESEPKPEPPPQQTQEAVPEIQVPVAALRQEDVDLGYRAKQIYAGQIELGNEEIDFVITPKAKQRRLLDVATPVQITGT